MAGPSLTCRLRPEITDVLGRERRRLGLLLLYEVRYDYYHEKITRKRGRK